MNSPDVRTPGAASRFASVVVFAVLFCGPAGASEIRAALGGWHFDVAGAVHDGTLNYDFEDDLNLKSQGEFHLELEWRAPEGWWPDVVLSWSSSKATGGQVFPGAPPLIEDRTLSADADTSELDVTLRYPINWDALRFSAGLNLKRVASDIRIEDSAEDEPTDEKLNLVFPQAHVAARLPLGELFALSATFQGVKFQDNTAYDVRAGVEFLLFDPILVEAGWQRKRYDVSDGSYALDATLDGLLLRLRARFPL